MLFRSIVLGEREASGKVRSDIDGSGSLSGGFLEVGHDSGVDGLLDGDSLGRDLVGGLLGSELGASSVSLVAGSSGEGGIVDFADINTSEGDGGGGGHGVNLVDALDGDTVNLVGSGNEEESRIELLEEDDSLSSESSGEEDEDATSFEASSELSGSLGLDS